MTVASETNKSGPYAGNGVTTAFDYDFRIVNEDHVQVIKTSVTGVETILVKTVNYGVTGVGATNGGQVIIVGTPPATGEQITLIRNVPFVQETDLENQGAYNAEDVEDALDLATMRDQQLSERLDRAVRIPVSADPSALDDLVADVIRLADSADNIDTVAGISGDVTAVADIADTLVDNLTDIHNFADVYQGAKATDPATRNDGDPLLAGDLYFNTTVNALRIYDGAEWRDSTAMTLNMSPKSFVGNGVQTAFTLDVAAGVSANVLVWLGGVRQVPGVDYLATGTTLTFVSAPGLGVGIDTLVVSTVSQLDVPTYGTTVWPVEDLTALAALPGAAGAAYLKQQGRWGEFVWDGSDLSATMVTRTVSVLASGVNTGTETFSMRTATGTVDDATDIINSVAHGFVADQEIYVAADTLGLIARAKYFVYFDANTAAAAGGNANNFKLRVSLTAGAFNFASPGAITVNALHDILSGQAVIATATVDGLTANTIYYANRVNGNQFRLAPTYLDAIAGTNLINITAANAVTFKVLLDPLRALYVPRAGTALDGSQGAWVRKITGQWVLSSWFGAVGDDATDNAAELQHWDWMGFNLRLPTWLVPGLHQTSRPIVHTTRDWLFNDSLGTKSPQNGVTVRGAGGEVSIIKASAAFPNSTKLIKLDGNFQAVAEVVSSRTYGQGRTVFEDIGLRGRGIGTGTLVGGFELRGCWGLDVSRIDMRDFSGNFFEVTTGGSDEVDNMAQIWIENSKFFNGGASCFVGRAVRIANFHFVENEVRNFNDYGLHATVAYSEVSHNVFDKIGNRDTATTGAVRLVDALTGTESRTIDIVGNVFENNFNMDIDVVSGRGGRIVGNSLHTFLPTGGVVVGKASVKLRLGTAGGTHNWVIENNRWPQYGAPSDGARYDVPNVDIAAGVQDTFIRANVTDTTTTFVQAASAVRLKIECRPTYTIVTTGTAPVDSFKNGVSLGSITATEWGFIPRTSFTPVVAGLTTPGTGAGTFSGNYERIGNAIFFSATCSVTTHSGTGDMVITGLPVAASHNAVVNLAHEGLNFSSVPFAEILAGESQVRIRQAAANAAASGVPVDAAFVVKVSGMYFVS